MADFRSVQTRMWREDEWFQNLPIDARLFWVYLFTNPSASICGMYRLPVRTMAFESGLSEDRVTNLLAEFSQAGKAFYEDGTVWVFRMRDNQLGRKISENQRKGINSDLEKIPPSPLKNRYLIHYGYPIDTLSETPDTLSIPRATHTHTHTLPDTVSDDTVSPGKARPPNAHYETARTLAEVCHMDFALNEKKCLKHASDLRKAAPLPTPELIRERYNGGGWWYENDWRGKRGEIPNLATIRETWGQWATATLAPADSFKPVKIYE